MKAREYMVTVALVVAVLNSALSHAEAEETGNATEVPQAPDFAVEFSPPVLYISQGKEGSVEYNMSFLLTDTASAMYSSINQPASLIQVTSNDREIAEVLGQTVRPLAAPYALTSAPMTVTGNFSVSGLWLGTTTIYLTISGRNQTVFSTPYTVKVLRPRRAVDVIFNVVLGIAIIISNFMFGCLFDISSAKEILKRPVAPIIGFLCQYTIMPTTSYLVGWALGLDLPIRLGLLGVGCSPGGGNSNVWTLNLNGDVTLSLVMTFISNMCALFMMPLWLLTLGQSMVGTSIPIPFEKIISALCLFIFPILVGLGVTKWKPIVGKFVRKVVRPYTLTQVAFILIVGLWSYSYIFHYCSDWRIPLAGMMLPYTGLLIGMGVAAIFKQGKPRIITIGIETALQNGALALVILRRTLAQPEADVASVAPIISAILTPIPLIITFIILIIKTKCIDRIRGKGQYAKADTEDKGDASQEEFDDIAMKQPLDDNDQTAVI